MRHLPLVLLIVAACSKSVTHEQAAAACDHQVELGYWKGFDETVKSSGQDPKAMHATGQTELDKQKKTDEWKKLVEKCATGFEKATPGQLDCVMKATTTDGAMSCLTE